MTNLIIVSGRSGSGKTVALNILEDLGYYCIDNLPVELLPDLSEKIHNYYKSVAVSIDARNLIHAAHQFEKIYHQIKKDYQQCEIVFIDADNQTLIRRFSETRRKHPLTNANTSLKEALNTEQTLLQPIVDNADLRIETSRLNANDLRRLILERIGRDETGLSLLFQSFGHKFGVPPDTDFTFDVRCLPNPYWETLLRDKTGQDEAVIAFLEKFPETTRMYTMIEDFIETWLPAFEAENRRYLTISVGCTGGRHRSVYFTEKLGNHFATKKKNVTIRHRDL